MRPRSGLRAGASREQRPPGSRVVARVCGEQQEPADDREGKQPPRHATADDGGRQSEDEKQRDPGECGEAQRHTDRVDRECDEPDSADGEKQKRVGGGHGCERRLRLVESDAGEFLEFSERDGAGE